MLRISDINSKSSDLQCLDLGSCKKQYDEFADEVLEYMELYAEDSDE